MSRATHDKDIAPYMRSPSSSSIWYGATKSCADMGMCDTYTHTGNIGASRLGLGSHLRPVRLAVVHLHDRARTCAVVSVCNYTVADLESQLACWRRHPSAAGAAQSRRRAVQAVREAPLLMALATGNGGPCPHRGDSLANHEEYSSRRNTYRRDGPRARGPGGAFTLHSEAATRPFFVFLRCRRKPITMMGMMQQRHLPALWRRIASPAAAGSAVACRMMRAPVAGQLRPWSLLLLHTHAALLHAPYASARVARPLLPRKLTCRPTAEVNGRRHAATWLPSFVRR